MKSSKMYPGLDVERMGRYRVRYRVRSIGNSKKKTTIRATPEEPEFYEEYRKARGDDDGSQTRMAYFYSHEPSILKMMKKSVTRAKDRARNKGHDFNLDADAMVQMFFDQGGACAVSGELMKFRSERYRDPHLASIDRIDSSKGYVIGNVQLVTTMVNIAKSNFSDSEFLNMCQKVIARHNLQKGYSK